MAGLHFWEKISFGFFYVTSHSVVRFQAQFLDIRGTEGGDGGGGAGGGGGLEGGGEG